MNPVDVTIIDALLERNLDRLFYLGCVISVQLTILSCMAAIELRLLYRLARRD